MPHALFLPALIGLALASVTLMLYGAVYGDTAVMIAAAAAFAGITLYASWSINVRIKNSASTGDSPIRVALLSLRATSMITALVYFWGGLAMFLMYEVSGLTWQHGWQYALGMGAIGAAIAAYALGLRRANSWLNSDLAIETAIRITLLHGLAAAAALFWLLISGKLLSAKGDWAANIIFVSGGVAVAGICAIVIRTYRTTLPPPVTS